MQPLAYLAVRACIGWIQFLECDDRAFLSNVPIVLTTGPVHCWSVVYALFIAVHLRTFRHYGSAEYETKLPFWMWGIETITVLSTVVWWVASCGLTFVRVVSDDMFGLPQTRYDSHWYMPKLFRYVLSKPFREILATAHMFSGFGLFLSVLVICSAMPFQPGAASFAENCLIFVAFAFALVHAIIAARSTFGEVPDREQRGMLAAAAEGAALGPQLCIVLSLADVPGNPTGTERMLYAATVVAFATSMCVCALHPQRVEGMAVPPRISDLSACAVLNVVAACMLLLCFPPTSNWPMVLLVLVLVFICFLLARNEIRVPMAELLEPIMPMRTHSGKMRQMSIQEGTRVASRVVTILCAMVVLRDIQLHVRAVQSVPVPTPNDYFNPEDYDSPTDHDVENHLENYEHFSENYDHNEPTPSEMWEKDHMDKWSADNRLTLRWRATATFPGQEAALKTVGQALLLDVDKLAVEKVFEQHRLLLFKFQGPMDRNRPSYNVHEHWQEILNNGEASLADFVDFSFPAYLDASLCLELPTPSAGVPSTDDVSEDSVKLQYVLKDVREDARSAYAVACNAWRRKMFPEEDIYGAPPDPLDLSNVQGIEDAEAEVKQPPPADEGPSATPELQAPASPPPAAEEPSVTSGLQPPAAPPAAAEEPSATSESQPPASPLPGGEGPSATPESQSPASAEEPSAASESQPPASPPPAGEVPSAAPESQPPTPSPPPEEKPKAE
mmetsp:Transcript_37006/g.73238  ORF Transcript_37006/g.73238 Transcript_37006/m.73238 type:complete len:728 (-) Transcript_37006:156-2339(-)